MKILEDGRPSITVSGFMDFCKSPYHYYYFHILGKKKYSDAMTLGRALHSAVFEPDKFESEFYSEIFAPQDSVVLKTVADLKNYIESQGVAFKKSLGKAELEDLARSVIANQSHDTEVILWSDLEQQFESKTKITQTMMEKVIEMRDSIFRHNYFKLVGLGSHEEYASGDIFGIEFRGRLDSYREISDKIFVTDLKTTPSAEAGSFAKSIQSFKYHVQAFLYSELLKISNPDKPIIYTYLATETQMPYITESWACSQVQMDIAREIVRVRAWQFKKCLADGVWPTYTDGKTNEINLPKWAEDEAASLMELLPEEEYDRSY